MVDLEQRKRFIGSSDSAAILGMSKWKTPLAVYSTKVLDDKLMAENREQTDAQEEGQAIEEYTAMRFAKKNPKYELLEIPKDCETGMPIPYIHRDYEFIGANPDRLVRDKETGDIYILELKNVSAYKLKEWADENTMPQDYIIQVLHQLMCYPEAKGGFIWAFIGGNKFILREVKRDQEMMDLILEREVAFWNDHVIPMQPPMVTGADVDSEILKTLYPEATPETTVELSGELHNALHIRKELIVKAKELDTQITEIENRIRSFINDKETAVYDGKVVATWKNQSSKRINTTKLKSEAPEVYLKYAEESVSRKLDIKIK